MPGLLLGDGLLLGVAAGVVLTVLLLFARQVARHRRLTRGLLVITRPEPLAGLSVRVGPVGGAAFAAGLGRPEIFCDERLPITLTAQELRAVTLHERAHQLARDPLRTAALAAVAPLVRPVPRAAGWLERLAARREIAADRFALSQGVSRAAIASALLKVRRFEPVPAPGFATAVDLRLLALLDEGPQAASRLGRAAGLVATGVVLAGVACLLLFHSWGTSPAACC